ncbi:MAG: hypothetical protein A3K10_10535 [Bacteroidetes bacterium RIFCSPLOWO2_12_FULL_31_6]|nr:MAG: hypothetical protein A3K10_10535 [Bacteroidetes bacterium RIFCSPLOWO2_12_FULL_31_6]
MAKSTYISANLTEEQIKLLQYLDAYEISYFSIPQLQQQYGNVKVTINELVENLYQKDFLTRVERGIYAKSTFNNVAALALFIAKKGSVAYWSALHHHGLTERFPNTQFIKTPCRKRNTTILGTTVKYVSVQPKKCIGEITQGYGDNKITLTNIETTLIDCFDQPRYAGDFENLIKAFAKASLSAQKLISYTKAYNNMALTKRLGYLASLFHPIKLKTFTNYAQTQTNKKYNLLDAGGIEKGAFNSQWKLRLNVTEEAILKMEEDSY